METIRDSIRDRDETPEVSIISFASSLPVACLSAHGLFQPPGTPSAPCVPQLSPNIQERLQLASHRRRKQQRTVGLLVRMDDIRRRFSDTPSSVQGAGRHRLVPCSLVASHKKRMRILQRDQGGSFSVSGWIHRDRAGWDIIRLPL